MDEVAEIVPGAGLAAFNACADARCVSASENLEGVLLVSPTDPLRLDSGAPNAAVGKAGDPFAAAIAADADGGCRDLGNPPPDIGPDEAG